MKRPPSSVLSLRIVSSVVLQFICHSCSISTVAVFSYRFIDPFDSSSASDGTYHANVLNTSTFLVSLMATVSTFWINYQGHPYMKSLRENKLLMRSLQACYILIALLVLEVFPPMNDLLQLAPLPSKVVSSGMRGLSMRQPFQNFENFALTCIQSYGFKAFLSFVACLDCVSAYIVDRLIKE